MNVSSFYAPGTKWYEIYKPPNPRKRPKPLVLNPTSHEVRYLSGNRSYDWQKRRPGTAGYYATLVQNARSGKASFLYKEEAIHSIDMVERALRNRLALKLRETPLNLGVALGEYKSTASTFAGACSKIIPLARAVKKFDFSKALRVLTGQTNRRHFDGAAAAADAWLGWSYGVRPILSDVHQSVNLLKKKSEENAVPYEVISARESFPIRALLSTKDGHRRIDGTIAARGKIYFSIDNPLTRQLQSLGLTNPLSIGWELIPFSFVIDWMVPIGDFIQAVEPPRGVSFSTGWMSVHVRGSSSQLLKWADGTETSYSTQEYYRKRSRMGQFPKYTFTVPDLSLTKSKAASALALMIQSMKR